MGQNLLTGGHLNDEKKAYEYLANLRWPDGPRCVHCKSEKVYTLNVKTSARVVLKCGKCRKQFSATMIIYLTNPLAFDTLCSSANGGGHHGQKSTEREASTR